MTFGEDLEVLARTVYGEARGGPYPGKLAVAKVIVHRAADPRWPDRIRDVCRQPYQFSCWLKGDPNRQRLLEATLEIPALRECLLAATMAICARDDPSKGANHYLTTELTRRSPPKWFDADKITAVVGAHTFLAL
jgi:N-acetylmuramoyl-L-alanine amidase